MQLRGRGARLRGIAVDGAALIVCHLTHDLGVSAKTVHRATAQSINDCLDATEGKSTSCRLCRCQLDAELGWCIAQLLLRFSTDALSRQHR